MFKSMVWTAVVRSLVQRGLEILLASTLGVQIVNLLAAIGLDFESVREQVITGVSVFLFGVIVAIVNALGPKFAWINKFVSLGLSRTAPAYVPNDADAVVSVANKNTNDTVAVVDTPPPGPNDAGPAPVGI